MRSFSKWTLAGLCLIATTGCGGAPYAPTSTLSPVASGAIFGTWAVPGTQTEGNFSYTTHIRIDSGLFSVITNCSLTSGQRWSATASAQAMVSGNQIVINVAAQNSQPNSGYSCNASVNPETLQYSVSGSTLTLTSVNRPGSMPVTLTRIQ